MTPGTGLGEPHSKWSDLKIAQGRESPRTGAAPAAGGRGWSQEEVRKPTESLRAGSRRQLLPLQHPARI